MKPRLPLTEIDEVNALRAMGNHPDALEAFFAFGKATYWGGSLDRRVREIAWLGASRANACHYWVPTHTVLGRSAGLTSEQMAHLGDESPPEGLYEGAEAVAQRYTVRSTRAQPIDDELYAELEAHFTQRQIMDLCFTVGLANLVNRFHATFHTALDESTPQVL